MPIETRPLSHAVGVEILGVDIASDLDDATIAAIRQALVENCVILFRDQDLTHEQHIAFSRRFGELPHYPALARELHPDHPEVWVLTNERQADGSPSPTLGTGRVWHSDQSFMAKPAMGSLLYCKAAPRAGGTTMFANMYRAYETLPDPLKKMVDGRRAEHNLNTTAAYRARHPNRTAEDEAKTPPVLHPIVRTHPETGRKALYVSEGITSRIEGLTAEESKVLLDLLNRHATHPILTYRHHWRVDDLIFWDNRCALHYAPQDLDHDAPGNRRLMYRTTVAGDAPY